MSKHFLFALLAVLFSVLPARAETIVVAADATWPPFEMLDENKQVTGYGPDYIRAAAPGKPAWRPMSAMWPGTGFLPPSVPTNATPSPHR